MDQRQKNARKMYGNVLYFFLHAGNKLMEIKRIADLTALLTTGVKAVDDEAKKQVSDTSTVTRTRADVKKECAEKAEALRGLVQVLATDTKVLADTSKSVSGYFYSSEATFLTYCQTIADAVDTLDPNDLDPKETGYDPEILNVLVADLAALNDSTGEVVEMKTIVKAATSKLVTLFAAVETNLLSLDKFVHFQRFAQGTLVEQYDALRTLPKTPVHEEYRAQGPSPYNEPQLIFNILEQDVPTPTLYNDSSRAHGQVFYLGATPASRPRPGQGFLLKNGKTHRVTDYAELGDPTTEPYLLVMQTSQLAPGAWRIRG